MPVSNSLNDVGEGYASVIVCFVLLKSGRRYSKNVVTASLASATENA
jgi:hypothetical protein